VNIKRETQFGLKPRGHKKRIQQNAQKNSVFLRFEKGYGKMPITDSISKCGENSFCTPPHLVIWAG